MSEASCLNVTNTLLELLQNESFNRSTLKKIETKCNNCTLRLVISELHDAKDSRHATSDLDSLLLLHEKSNLVRLELIAVFESYQ